MTAALPASMLIHTATWIVPSTSTDVHGNAVRNYTAPTSSTTVIGRFQQDQGTEPLTDGRDPLIRSWTFFTNEPGIGGYDRLVFGSLTFEVDGPPAPTYGSAAFHHAEVKLRLVEG